jgi:uncharacterized protein YjiS (DUF1127 family)
MKRLFEMLCRAWAMARTRRELHRLDDHILRDIGLRREQIDFIRLS